MPRFSSLVTRVRAEAPHVALASVTFRRRELVTMLANGDLDLALDVALPADERMCRHYLGAEPLVVVARQGHPRVDGAPDLDTYLALGHIIAPARPYGPGNEEMALDRIRLARPVQVRGPNPNTPW